MTAEGFAMLEYEFRVENGKGACEGVNVCDNKLKCLKLFYHAVVSILFA